MVMRFWLAGGGVMISGLMAGMGLGSYVTHIPASPPSSLQADDGSASASTSGLADSGPSPDALRGPMEIDCKGCGPTLPERRMAADMAALPVPNYGEQSYDDPPLPDPAMTRAIADAAPPTSPTPLAAGQGPVTVQPVAQDVPAP